MPLSKAQFASLLLKGEFQELVEDVLGTPKHPDLPAVKDSDPDHPKADNPLLALRGAKKIGPAMPNSVEKVLDFTKGYLDQPDPRKATDRPAHLAGQGMAMAIPTLLGDAEAGGPELEGKLGKVLDTLTTHPLDHLIKGIKSHIPSAEDLEGLEEKFNQLIHPDHAETIAKLTKDNQGATFHPTKGNLAGTEHYAVSTYPERTVITKGAPDSSMVQSFIKKNADLLKDTENSIGTWWDKEKNEFVLDVVKTPTDKAKALALGKQYGQDAIFDLKNLEEIRLPKEKPAFDLNDQTTIDQLFKAAKGEEGRMLDLEHRSPVKNLSTVDPSYFGQGPVGGAERTRLADPDFQKRSYFTIKGKPYDRGLSNLPVYTTKVAEKEVYPLAEDPAGLVKKAQAAFPMDNLSARTAFEKAVLQSGYKGYTDGNAVVWFSPLSVTGRGEESTASHLLKDEGGWIGSKERPKGLKITKDSDFDFNGQYNVILPNGAKVAIYKDASSDLGLWNAEHPKIKKMMDGTSSPFGFNKEDLLTKLHEIMDTLK